MKEGRDGAGETQLRMQDVATQLAELLQAVDAIAIRAQEMAAGAEQTSNVSTDIARRITQTRHSSGEPAQFITADAI